MASAFMHSAAIPVRCAGVAASWSLIIQCEREEVGEPAGYHDGASGGIPSGF